MEGDISMSFELEPLNENQRKALEDLAKSDEGVIGMNDEKGEFMPIASIKKLPDAPQEAFDKLINTLIGKE